MGKELSLNEMFDALTGEQKAIVYAIVDCGLSSEMVCAVIAEMSKLLNKKWENENAINHIFKKVEEAIEKKLTYINFAEDPYWDNVDALSPIILGYLRRLGYRFFRKGRELCMTWFEDDAYIRGAKGEEE